MPAYLVPEPLGERTRQTVVPGIPISTHRSRPAGSLTVLADSDTVWIMQQIRSEPRRQNDVASPEAMREAIRVLGLVDAMGLFQLREPASYFQLSLLREAADAAAHAGIGRSAAALLATDQPNPRLVFVALRQLAEALEDSPLPQCEARELGRVLGWEFLAAMVNASAVSVRRYASNVREAPDDVAGRLHLLALIVGNLKGAYNDAGIRRWFERPRVQLRGRAPKEVFHGDWTPDQREVLAVRELANSLAGAGAA